MSLIFAFRVCGAMVLLLGFVLTPSVMVYGASRSETINMIGFSTLLALIGASMIGLTVQ